MGCPWLLILGLVLNVAHCLEILGEGQLLEITHNITGVLGEDVYLSCSYLGESEIINAQWKRQTNSKVTARKLVGFLAENKTFHRDNSFSFPVSRTNLTVKTRVTSVEVEGEYICEFGSNEEDVSGSVFLTVVARPDIYVQVNAETINGTHYQSVSCSAVGGRPMPQISWLVNSVSPSAYPLTTETLHSNSTSTLSSIHRFATHLLEEDDSVTCVIQHPTLPNPKLITASLETYARPNVTIKAEMVQQGGNEFWVVSCISSGGRPDTDISLALNTDEEREREDDDTDSQTQTVSFRLPVTTFEGRNVTCVFDHPKFTQKESRVITLPSFYLSGVQLSAGLGRNSDPIQAAESLELQEGQSDAVIGLEVTGNVPRYNISCKKDDGSLPEDVELVGSNLTIQGPVVHQHAGQYECVTSYHRHRATLQFNITVKPQVLQPVPPTIRVDLQTEDGHSVIECSAADAVPAANMSWHLPEGVSGVSWFNFTSHNGNHSVRGVLLLPACSPWELTAECMINHPAFEEPENRSVTLPLCAHPNITINSSTEWSDGDAYTKVDCSVDSVAPAATITWHVGNGDNSISYLTETRVQADGLVSTRSSVRLLSSLNSGQNLTCMVEHPSLEAPEEKTIHICTVHKAPLLNVSLSPQDSPLFLAVCDCRGEGVGVSPDTLTWVLPENEKDQTSLHWEYEGHALKARLTYQFHLALHEGHDLVCVYQCEHGFTERITLHVPRYHISSVRVLNHTTSLRSRYGGKPHIHRMTFKKNHHNQRILLKVDGNMPNYNLSCRRSDGFFVKMEGDVAVFQSELTEQDEGLYTCQASFYHHTATVNILVEVIEDELYALVVIICISSASAIILVLVVTLWVFCKRNRETQYERKESLSALTTLMQQPGSPEVKKPEAETQLVSYSIVIDVKSTV